MVSMGVEALNSMEKNKSAKLNVLDYPIMISKFSDYDYISDQ